MKLWNKITGIYTHTVTADTEGTGKRRLAPEFLDQDNHRLVF